MSEPIKKETRDLVAEIRAKAARGEVEAAISELDDLIATRPDKRVWEYERACIQVNKSAPSDALRIARAFSGDYPEYAFGILLVATTLANVKRYKEAIAEVDRSEVLSGPTQSSRSIRAAILYASGRKVEARTLTQFDASLPDANARSLRTWAGFNPPKDEEQLYEVMDRLRAAGETGEGLAIFEANWFAVRGQNERAATLYEAADAKYPDHEPIVVNYAAVEWSMGRHTSLVTRLEKAFKQNPTSYPVGGMLARAYFRRVKVLSAIWVIVQLIRSQLRLS